MTGEKPYGKDAVVKAILEAAVPLIAEKGVASVTFRDIAQRATVNHSLIARHFGTKEDLIQQVGEYLGYKLFHNAKSRGTDFSSVWNLAFTEQRVELRAIARIMLEMPALKHDGLAKQSLMKEIFDWFKESFGLDQEEDPSSTNMVIYITASLLIGSEIFAPHIQQVLGLDEEAFEKLRPRAFQLILGSFLPKKE